MQESGREQSARRDASELASLLEGSPDALIVVDDRGDIVLVNGLTERMFGRDRSELIGRPYDLLMPEGLTRDLVTAQSGPTEDPVVRRAGTDLGLRARRRDGTVFPIEVHYAPVETGTGQVVVASVRDVSHRQRTESELRETLSLLAATLESTADGILVVSKEGRIAGSNEQFASMWGIPTDLLETGDDERAIGYALGQLVDPDAFLAKVHDLYDDPGAESNDVLHFLDGRVFERYSRPQRVGDEIVGRVWSFRDVTPRHQAQEQARQALADLSVADARFRALVESSDDSILSTTRELTIDSWNAAAERLFGYPREEILGRPLELLIPEGRRAAATQVNRETLDHGVTWRSGDANGVRKDGVLVPISLTISPIYEGEAIVGLAAIIRDISESRARQRELEEAQEAALDASQAKSDFLATMSHEIRTPMNGVIGLTGLLLNTHLDEVQRRYAAGVRGAGEALLGIIDDILDFSKLEAGKVDLEEVDFSPRDLVEEVAVLIGDSASAQGLELVVHCDPSVPAVVTGDPGRLRQTLINLAGNAVKFTPEGEVVVRVTAMPRATAATMAPTPTPAPAMVTLRFEVSDTGIGIDEAMLGRLFEPFSQADASTTRRFGGTGLGLAISHRLVSAMGGDLVATSEPGVGSTFGFSLRLAVADEPESPSRTLRMALGRRALVVDDNLTNRQVLVAQLGSWGMRADQAPDAETALDMLRGAAREAAPYHVALVDLRMPGTDGLGLADAIAGEAQLATTRVMVLTSGGALDEERASRARVREWVSKPVRLGELREALGRLLERRVPGPRPEDDEQPPAPAGPGSTGRVLVAEDNPVNQLVAMGVLEELGYTVELVSDGREALARLADTRFDAVLMDCHMPEVDGFEATRELRRREGGGRRTPVIAMTAGVLDEDRERCLAAGMDDFVGKPVNVEHLRHTLVQWVTPTSSRTVVEGSGTVRTASVLTRSRLDALRTMGPSDGWGLLPAVVEAFLEGSREQLEQVRAAARAGAAQELREIAHSLRGAAANLGAEAVIGACTEIEHHVQAEGVVPADGLVDHLARELDLAAAELAALLEGRG